MSIIPPILDVVRHEFAKPEPKWTEIEMSQNDIEFMKKECNKPSPFDPLNKRKHLLTKMLNKEAPTLSIVCEYGTVNIVFENIEQKNDIPYGLWGRILRLFSEKNKPNKPFKIYFLANTHLREFPTTHKKQIAPQNINGGYTYHCNKETICIYRAEDATRVLIHELHHACCLDRMENGIDIVEAETEAWAELLYIALLSRGKKDTFTTLLKLQSNWMIQQNKIVEKHMKNPTTTEFPWRYTIGKEMVWRKWGILQEPKASLSPQSLSLRLTRSPTNSIKQSFGVSSTSTIL